MQSLTSTPHHAAVVDWRFWGWKVMPFAPVCGETVSQLQAFLQLHDLHWAPALLQDDTYTESYISTIGVDFVSPLLRSCSQRDPHLSIGALLAENPNC